jgi:SAM-dependent methyltransferase
MDLSEKEIVDISSCIGKFDSAETTGFTEIEVRFGNFDRNGKFSPNIKKDIMEKIKNDVKATYTGSSEIYYYNDNRRIVKKYKKVDGVKVYSDEIYERKETKEKIDIVEYNVRISRAEEFKIVSFDETDCCYKREKDTYQYNTKDIRYDICVIRDGDGVETSSVEIELTGKTTVNTFIQNIEYVLRNIQNSYFLTKKSEEEYVLKKYKELSSQKNPVFSGMQPVTMSRTNMEQVMCGEQYTVTDKADGDRKLLIILPSGCYFITNNMKLEKTNFISNSENCNGSILDGEFINNNLYSVFDIMVYSGKDLRDNSDYNLIEREKILVNVITHITSDVFFIQAKKYLYGDVYSNSKLILDYFKRNNTPYKIDGLIFTPVNHPYQTKKTNLKLLKWKPSGINTIDFLITKKQISDTREEWILYSQESNRQVFFKPVGHEGVHKVEMSIEDGREYYTNTVVEMYYKNGGFLPMRTRWDKTNNESKKGNYITVALDIFKNILNPVTEDMITRKRVVKKGKNELVSMRTFHNWLKGNMMKKYTPGKETLLDLACGKAGDLHKWNQSDIKKVVGIDINEASIKEARKRTNNTRSSTHIDFHVLDLSRESISSLNIVDKFDIINCQFALHYFYESEDTARNFFKNVSSHLDDNGIFIGTVFDGMKVFNALKDSDIEYVSDDGELLFKIEKMYNSEDFSELKEYGEEIKVYMGCETVLSDKNKSGTIEYMVNFNKLIELANEYSLEIVEGHLFNSLYQDWIINNNGIEMSLLEKEISFLNRTFVFKKKNISDNIINIDEFMNCIYTQAEIINIKDSVPVEVKPVEVKPVAVKPVAVKPVEVKPVEVKPVEVKPVAVKPVEVKPVAVKPVAAKPVEAKPVEAKPVEAKPVKPVAVKPVEFSKMNMTKLKEICRERKLKVSGNKQDLIDRLS